MDSDGCKRAGPIDNDALREELLTASQAGQVMDLEAIVRIRPLATRAWLVGGLLVRAVQEREPGCEAVAGYLLEQARAGNDRLEYRPCRCDGLPFPHRPGSRGCRMPADLGRAICSLRERRERYAPCTCSAYPFPHRPGGGRCSAGARDLQTRQTLMSTHPTRRFTDE